MKDEASQGVGGWPEQYWQQLQGLFNAALERDGAEREAFVAEACAGDEGLRQRLERLLLFDARSGLLLDRWPTADMGLRPVGVWDQPPSETPQRIGQYRILRIIGSGGMGTVYEAEQPHPRRTVAVKVLPWGIASQQALRRFEYESHLLARLRHPGIAQVYEAGTHVEGNVRLPYFAMEYVPGALPITHFARERMLTMRQRVELFAQICDAVHHGHQRGVIHRDLKPGNILVDADGQPRVIDFGVARATDTDLAVTTMQTSTGQLVGTLQYMSPEQFEADSGGLDVRSDVYSLGVVLYELLAGRLPYEVAGKTAYEVMGAIREGPVTSLGAANPRLRGDLETVAAKAMEKDRERRYRSATELADDLRRYLAGNAILARPSTRAYQLRVFVRRNKLLVGAAAAVVLALLLGFLGTGAGMLQARAARDVAQRKADHARAVSDYVQRVLLAARSDAKLNGLDLRVSDLLDRAGGDIEAALRGQPEAEIEVRVMLARAYNAVFAYQDYAKTAEHYGRAYELSRGMPDGAESERTLSLAAEYALPLSHLPGRHAQARKLAREVHDTARRRLGEWHPVTFRAAHALALAIKNGPGADLAEAERMMRSVFQHVIARPASATPPEMYAVLADFPLMIRQNLRNPAEGERLARRAIARVDADPRVAELAIFRSRLGRQLAAALSDQGDVEQGAVVATEALGHARQHLGAFHPETRMRLTNWVEAMRLAGRSSEATQELERELEPARRTLRGDDVSLAYLLADLGKLWVEMGLQEQGLALVDEAVTIRRRRFGANDPLALMWGRVNQSEGKRIRSGRRPD